LKNILFRCDSSTILGLGHVKRCLVLAKRLKEYSKNVKISFATQDLNGNINLEILQSGFSIYSLKDNSLIHLDYFLKALEIDLLIIDSYDIDWNFEKELKSKNPALKILCFDDTLKPHCSDMVLNHGIQAQKKQYKDLLPKKTKLFCGSEYTLLRDEFLESKKEKTLKNSVAIILGGNDILNLSSEISDFLLEIDDKYKVSIITTSVNPNISELAQNKNIKLLLDISNIAEVLASKELVICSTSGVLFEVMALKKKFINIEVADNQGLVSKFLERKKIRTTIKAEDLTKELLRTKIDYVKINNSYKKLSLNFKKNKIARDILKELE
jgi:UDP-2,4-diacetamido-2,4,6-trideoxy-beta-L-altropyranose hydrolase